MATGSQYPTKFPTESVGELIRIIRAGTIDEERSRFVKELSWVSLYGLMLSFGDPDAIQPVGTSLAKAVEELEELETLLHDVISVSKAGFNWTIIVALVQLLLSILGDDEE